MKIKYLLFLAPLLLCGCNTTERETLPQTAEATADTRETTSDEAPFTGTMDEIGYEELSPADPVQSLSITPSDYFTPGVWTSLIPTIQAISIFSTRTGFTEE